ncbi:DUF72 domain-containing protein [Thiohalobacter sp.]|uniref:DUF72 domain-containing protein n=1 Tax=Thiohalobacter sp. TaxID=2025948 RepID=UPI002624BF19|nr:DUF72 domain-containing protein [Thiohalobacter sp.]
MTAPGPQPALRIGTSGYRYPHWRGPVYPAGLPEREWFAFYARHFDSVEINNTFYGLPSAESFRRWREAAPEGFRYALKLSGQITHRRRLHEVAEPLERFLERARLLGATLGPILIQLPPRWRPDWNRLDEFLKLLPEDLDFALEVRDARWLDAALYARLEARRVALCLHDLIPAHPLRLTADWTYLRFHGQDYSQPYSPQKLAATARRIVGWLAQGIGVHAYFNNDAEGHAFRNALMLKRYLARRGWPATASAGTA